MGLSEIKAIAIDLDDTLIDTSGLLVPLAAKRACLNMISEGLHCSLEECVALRAQLAVEYSHRELFALIAQRAGHDDFARIGDIGAHAFYGHTDLPSPLPLLPDALETLEELKGRYRLFLVTAGIEATQRKKISLARLEPFFEEIFVIDKFQNKNKATAFEAILQKTLFQPQELLSLGNRLKEEIRLAKRLGARTCYFEYGEHVGETPQEPADHPDFRIHRWQDFIRTCQL